MRPARRPNSSVSRAILWTCASSMLLACSGNSDEANVTGRWCGRAVATPLDCTGDEVSYLHLTQKGPAVTGKRCESYGHECYDVQAGLVEGNKLTFFYTFSTDRVDAAFAVNGDTMTGTYRSTKASSPIPVTLHRIP